MMKLTFRIFVLPIYHFLVNSFELIKLKHKYPTLSVERNAKIKGTILGNYNYIGENVNIFESEIGNYSYVSRNTRIRNTKIGRFTTIGPNSQIGLGNHPTTTFASIHPIFYSAKTPHGKSFANKKYFEEFKNTSIGSDVWIGSNVIIPGGVTICNGAIIASGAVVTKDVSAYSIVGGVPAKIIKYRFSQEERDALESMQWWNMPEEKLKKNFLFFHNVKSLIEQMFKFKD